MFKSSDEKQECCRMFFQRKIHKFLLPSYGGVKVILRRIIFVVDLVEFPPEAWTKITLDDETRRPPLSVKQVVK